MKPIVLALAGTVVFALLRGRLRWWAAALIALWTVGVVALMHP